MGAQQSTEVTSKEHSHPNGGKDSLRTSLREIAREAQEAFNRGDLREVGKLTLNGLSELSAQEISPEDTVEGASLLNLLGLGYLGDSSPEVAVKVFRKLISSAVISPSERALAHRNLGVALTDSGSPLEAREHFLIAYREYHRCDQTEHTAFPHVLICLGSAEFAEGNWKRAAKYFREADGHPCVGDICSPKGIQLLRVQLGIALTFSSQFKDAATVLFRWPRAQ